MLDLVHCSNALPWLFCLGEVSWADRALNYVAFMARAVLASRNHTPLGEPADRLTGLLKKHRTMGALLRGDPRSSAAFYSY